ncbi:MAG TPA: NAD-dependent 4,6-dehydratase LegB [Gammaproteobacteria bacterium]|nr:MAG: NAD-dependent dehydratase [Gammaproteobacteria bacterium RIFCSPHIGHO2_12_FULL_41_20]HLB43539.1 NAD-dependent 4,6-dehydratase LegB [Gammaproteobacteria bacterium]
MNLLAEKIFVTGADGFIGSHLVERLVSIGCSVRAFVCYNSFGTNGWLDTLPSVIKDSIEIQKGDIRDIGCVKKAMKECGIVLHLAALIGIPYSYYSPYSYIDTNINGTLNIVQASLELGVQKIIHTSTSEVYGTARYVPIDEAHPLQAQSPYSASKIGADQIAMSFYTSFEVPVSIIRPFNTFGPRQSTRAFIPTVIMQIHAGQKKIQLGSLSPTRDFSFVADTVSGFIEMAKSDRVIGEVVNFGSNFEISMANTVQLIANQMGASIEVIQDKQRLRPPKSEVERLWADNRRALQLTDWQPQYSGKEGFIRGLKETIKWYQATENMKYYQSTLYNV